MGVPGLEEYIQNKCKHAIVNVDLFKLQEKPLFVFDGTAIVPYLIRNSNWVFGGQWKELHDSVSRFITSFTAKGARLVFFMPSHPEPTTELDMKQITSGMEYISLFNKQPQSDFYINPPTAFYSVGYAIQSCGVECRYAVNNLSEEIAAFAKVNHANGIFSQDSDFLIYATAPGFLLNTLDTDNMTADFLDRDLFAKHLSLSPNQLPLLSCLLGNEVIPQTQLAFFHRYLQRDIRGSGRGIITDIMPRISMYVRPHGPTIGALRMLARNAFHDENQADTLQKAIGRYSLKGVTGEGWKPESHHALYDQYDIEVYDAAFNKQLECRGVPFVYEVLCNQRYQESATVYHEPSLLCNPSTFYLPQRKRCYGIICGEKSVKETIAMTTQVIEPCQIAHKGKLMRLNELWGDHSGDLKWKMFVECAQVTFDDNLARALPSQYLGLCCILNFWWHNDQLPLAQWELNALIAQAVSPYAVDVPSLQRVLVTFIDPRAVSFAGLFCRGAEALLQIASVTGLPSDPLHPENYFDGRLFSYCYYLAKHGSSVEALCDNRTDRIEMFKFLLMVIKSDKLSMKDSPEDNAVINQYDSVEKVAAIIAAEKLQLEKYNQDKLDLKDPEPAEPENDLDVKQQARDVNSRRMSVSGEGGPGEKAVVNRQMSTCYKEGGKTTRRMTVSSEGHVDVESIEESTANEEVKKEDNDMSIIIENECQEIENGEVAAPYDGEAAPESPLEPMSAQSTVSSDPLSNNQTVFYSSYLDQPSVSQQEPSTLDEENIPDNIIKDIPVKEDSLSRILREYKDSAGEKDGFIEAETIVQNVTRYHTFHYDRSPAKRRKSEES